VLETKRLQRPSNYLAELGIGSGGVRQGKIKRVIDRRASTYMLDSISLRQLAQSRRTPIPTFTEITTRS
jgi:hypothetical protein